MFRSKLKSLPLVLLLALAGTALAGFGIDMTDLYQDCDNGKPYPSVKLEDFETAQDDDGKSLLNGKMFFAAEYNDPIEIKIYSTRLKQGTWVEGEISKDVTNVCPLIMSASEPWYVITSAMKKQDCPYEAGHTETFEMLPLGDMGFDNLPESFAGDWRVYVESTTQRGTEKVTECFRVSFSIVEQ